MTSRSRVTATASGDARLTVRGKRGKQPRQGQLPRDGHASAGTAKRRQLQGVNRAASSPSATRSPTAAGSCSGASRCSRGRCGSARGLGLPFTGYAVDGARAGDVAREQVPAFAQRTALPDARYDLGCLYVGVNDVRAPDWDADAFARDYAAVARRSWPSAATGCCS